MKGGFPIMAEGNNGDKWVSYKAFSDYTGKIGELSTQITMLMHKLEKFETRLQNLDQRLGDISSVSANIEILKKKVDELEAYYDDLKDIPAKTKVTMWKILFVTVIPFLIGQIYFLVRFALLLNNLR